MTSAGQVARIRENRNIHIFLKKPEREHLEDLRLDGIILKNIKLGRKELHWPDLVQDRYK